MAAHISAASAGGPRYDPELTVGQRRSADNGIWLCQTHAKLIDDDPERFDVELLRRWRSRAERLAQREQGRPAAEQSADEHLVVEFARTLSTDPEQLRHDVDNFQRDVGVSTAWRDLSRMSYMFLYEVAINAVSHGGASQLSLTSSPGAITITENGARFGLRQLRDGRGGGGVTVRHIEEEAAGSLSLRHTYNNGFNLWSVVYDLVDRDVDTPCSVRKPRGVNLELLADCEEIHIYPMELWSASDWAILLWSLIERFPGRRVVVHQLEEDSLEGRLVLRIYSDAFLPD